MGFKHVMSRGVWSQCLGEVGGVNLSEESQFQNLIDMEVVLSPLQGHFEAWVRQVTNT